MSPMSLKKGRKLAMNSSTKQTLDIVESEFEKLLDEARNDVIRTKLHNLNEICHHLVIVGKQRLTVPDVVAAYAARVHAPNQSIAESSIRNKRGGANPFQKLYRVWESASVTIRGSSPRQIRQTVQEIMCEEDVTGIKDSVLRHQVSLLLAQNRSYRSQVDILKRVRSAPVVQLTTLKNNGTPLLSGDRQELTEAEREAVRDFLAAHKLKSRSLRWTENGGLETTDGRRLADPGFRDALHKLAENCAKSM